MKGGEGGEDRRKGWASVGNKGRKGDFIGMNSGKGSRGDVGGVRRYEDIRGYSGGDLGGVRRGRRAEGLFQRGRRGWWTLCFFHFIFLLLRR